MKKTMATTAVAAMLLTATAALAAPTAEERCEAGKNDAAGKYDACAAKAEKGLVSTGDTTKYADALVKCEGKLVDKWTKLEAEAVAAAAVCPSTGDQVAIQNFVDACVQSVAVAVGGGTVGPDPVTCNADLGSCTGDLGTCNSSLGTCNGNLGTCTGSLGTCNGNLATANAGTAAVGDVLSGKTFTSTAGLSATGTMPSNGAVTLTPTTSDQAIAAGYHNGSGKCSGDADLVAAKILTGVNLFGVSGSVIQASGAATAGNVLTGTTFSNAGGAGTGTMPSNGAVTLTPTTSDQAIAAGYHNGSGNCAGDADLVAANIKNGVDLFGVAGTLLAGGVQKTGQATCWDPADTTDPIATIACAGTGQDGDLQKGVANSFSDNGDGTITDNVTGLMWEKLADDGTIHDWENTYTWANAFASKVATLNSAGGFAGYTDWRVPNSKELNTLVNHGAAIPATFSAFNTNCTASCTVLTCSCTQSDKYWSSETSQTSPVNAWYMDFYSGDTDAFYKTYASCVRAVRAGS